MFRIFLRFTAVFLILVIPLVYINAESFRDNLSWAVNGSLLYFPTDNGVDSDPSAIIPSLGFSIGWRFWGPLKLEFTEDIYFTNYEYNAKRGYPMACNPENRSAFVLGFVTGLQLTGLFPIGDNGIALRVFGGPVADLRVVILALGLNHPADFTGEIETDPKLQTEAIRNYFWSNGRWFMPVIGTGMDFPINEKFMLGFDLRIWIPVYRFMSNEKSPDIDGWRFGLGFRISPRRKPVIPPDELLDQELENQEG
jgi:hypothetical protein